MSLQKHKHAEIIKAWADGAEIEHDNFVCPRRWSDKDAVSMLLFGGYDKVNFRIKPDCEYAIEKIRELGGEEAVGLYVYWLDGGKIELVLDNGQDDCWAEMDAPSENPFKEFTDCYSSFKYRKKKRKVKQVLWFDLSSSITWENEGNDPSTMNGKYKWHKVPIYTREIEVD